MFGRTWLCWVTLGLAAATVSRPCPGQQPPPPPRFDAVAPPAAANLPPEPLADPAVLPRDPSPGPEGDRLASRARLEPQSRRAAPQGEVFEAGQIIAWVGDQPIQAGDVLPTVDQAMAPALEKIPPDEREAQAAAIAEQRWRLVQRVLESQIEVKLLYLDFLRTIPDDKRKEAIPQITERAEEQFYEKQVPEALKKAQVNSPAELETALRVYGSSLERQKRAFVEKAMGQSALSQRIDYEPEITHQAMLDHYRDHTSDYARAARARWEKLTVRFDRFASKAEAWAALGEMGNEVLRGASFAAVARRQSQGVDAADGGYHDWTTEDSLASDALNEAIFALPVGQLSERIADEEGFHIVRVIERQPAGMVSFLEAQVEIKEGLRQQQIREQVNRYVAELKDRTTVWTIFDAEAGDTER